MTLSKICAAALIALAPSAFAGESKMKIAPSSEPFVASYLVKAKDGMSFEEFRAYQLETHVPLALDLPGLKAYRLFMFPPIEGQPQPFHGMAQVTFESSEAHDAALASPEGQAALADLPKFQNMSALTVLKVESENFLTGSN